MEKITLRINKETCYLSDVKINGKKFELPRGILAKGATGCGGTTLALEDEHKTIIASPRIKLLDCKARQYPDALLVIGGVKTDEVAQYIATHETPKILTTYDSLFKVANAIEDMTDWRVVVDEFQCILSDSTFKSDTEIRMIHNLSRFPYVTFMSATPLLDEYLEQIDVFKDIPFTQLVWEDMEKVEVIRHKTNNPIAAAVAIVREYQEGRFPMVEVDGEMVQSHEVCIFLNSVQNICNIIKKCEIKPEDVNIIVGDSDDNDKMLAKLGKGFVNSNAPAKGEAHKMFTFCTSTAYMGVDFYSTNATTFVISDCKRQNTAVDISTELPQIAGRQRLQENPFRGVIHFFFNTDSTTQTEEEFMQGLTERKEISDNLVKTYNIASGKARAQIVKEQKRLQRMMNYTETFVYYDDAQERFEINQMAYLSEVFAFKVQRETYRNGIMVHRQTVESDLLTTHGKQKWDVFDEQVENVITRTTFEEKMRQYIDYKTAPNARFNLLIPYMEQQTPELRDYYEMLGADRIRALGYKESKLRNEVHALALNNEIKRRLSSRLSVGSRYTCQELKDILNGIYSELHLKKSATAIKLSTEYGFTMEKHKVAFEDGRRDVYEIQKKPLETSA
ncbi:MAG: hypothetical protein Q4E26_02470 [Prevotellaceae bacterium]|nr:hypothetical protein [Prevotellaceae bacterium]